MNRPGLGSRRPMASEDLSFMTSIGGGPDRSTEIEHVPLDRVEESEFLCLRERPFPGIEQLAAQVRKHGQTTPVFVRPMDDGRFELVSGYRRSAALRSIQAPTILARIYRGLTDDEAYDLAVSENADRDDLTDWERAKACERLSERGRSHEDIARMFKWKDDRQVRNHIRLAGTSPRSVAEALQAGHLQATHALALLRMNEPPFSASDAVRITALVIERGLSVRGIQSYLDAEALRLVGRKATPNQRPQRQAIRVRDLKAGGFQVSARVTSSTSPEELDLVTSELKKLLRQLKTLRNGVIEAGASDGE